MNSKLITTLLAPLFLAACGTGKTSNSSIASASHKHATQSDLNRDLSGKLGELGTPFADSDANVALSSKLNAELAALMTRCAIQPVTKDAGGLETLTAPQSLCPSELGAITILSDKWTQEISFTVNGSTYTAVAFDGLDSDGGDESDLAVYDATGARIGLQKGMYVDSNVIGALASFSGIKLQEVRF